MRRRKNREKERKEKGGRKKGYEGEIGVRGKAREENGEYMRKR